jgi:microcystin-dependent protein
MSIGQRYYTPNPFEIDANGVPLAFAQLFFYATGTNTPQDTFSDVGLTVANANPVRADANGRFGSIFLATTNGYAVSLWTAPTTDNPGGVQVWTEDPVGPAAGGAVSNVVGIIGEIRQFAGIAASIPSGWYQCYGQAVSRTTYAAAFAALGTTWGAGDSSTTFNLPDLRGRVTAGLDNMGGSAADRITAGVSGIAGTTLGGSGGDQAQQEHTHTINDGGHTHALTDPGHVHTVNVATAVTGGSAAGLSATDAAPAVVPFGVNTATTGITIASATTGITNSNTGAGASQNVQPTSMVYSIIYLGA